MRVRVAYDIGKRKKRCPLIVFYEPTTGVHFHDIRTLLEALNDLVDQGHAGIVVEHNLEVIRAADWVIDLGPEGGSAGGYIVAEGTPEDIAKAKDSATGRYLKDSLSSHRKGS